jgi:hypothetical protein
MGLFDWFFPSADRDGPFLQLLLEEAALEQLRFHAEGASEGVDQWIGFPFALQVLLSRVPMDGRRISERKASAIVYAAAQLARQIWDRRQAEILERQQNPLDHSNAVNELARYFLYIETLPDMPRTELFKLPVRDREVLMKCADEACHRLRVALVGPEALIEVRSNSASQLVRTMPRDRAETMLKDVREELLRATMRADQWRFDLA